MAMNLLLTNRIKLKTDLEDLSYYICKKILSNTLGVSRSFVLQFVQDLCISTVEIIPKIDADQSGYLQSQLNFARKYVNTKCTTSKNGSNCTSCKLCANKLTLKTFGILQIGGRQTFSLRSKWQKLFLSRPILRDAQGSFASFFLFLKSLYKLLKHVSSYDNNSIEFPCLTRRR